MAVILNLEEEKVRQACREASTLGVVEPANLNCPGQIVISGEKAAVAAACEKAKALGAKRAVELPVGGPFHSSLMGLAVDGLRKALEKAAFTTPRVVYYSDIDAVEMKDPAAIAESLARQLTQPVRWTQVIQRMMEDGYSTFIEVGPGKVLGGLIKKISKDAQVLNAGDVPAVEALGKAP
jgi:[acyl-carrier-protein] S-malonyltransferase